MGVDAAGMATDVDREVAFFAKCGVGIPRDIANDADIGDVRGRSDVRDLPVGSGAFLTPSTLDRTDDALIPTELLPTATIPPNGET